MRRITTKTKLYKVQSSLLSIQGHQNHKLFKTLLIVELESALCWPGGLIMI